MTEPEVQEIVEDPNEQLFIALFEIVKELGWGVAVPNDLDDEAPVNGLIIGQSDYINGILNQIEKSSEVTESDDKLDS